MPEKTPNINKFELNMAIVDYKNNKELKSKIKGGSKDYFCVANKLRDILNVDILYRSLTFAQILAHYIYDGELLHINFILGSYRYHGEKLCRNYGTDVNDGEIKKQLLYPIYPSVIIDIR